MKIFRCSSLLAFALWHVGCCDGERVGAPKQHDGGLSNEEAPYDEKTYIRDETKSIVRIAVYAPNSFIASSNSKSPHRSDHSVSLCDPILRWKATPSQTGKER
jgi:hypothetical protein